MSSQELTARILRYPLDLTGTSPDNFVEAEVRELPNHRNRAVVLSNGAFYSDSLVIYDHITGERLTKKTQYTAAQLVEAATVRSGKEVCSVIIITDTSVSNQIRIDYQAVGGPYILNVDALVDMVNTLDLDNRPITWGAIIGKPDLFPPGHHLHDAGDVFGFEYMVLALEEIRKAILMGDIASHDELRAYIMDVESRLGGQVQAVVDSLAAHKADNQNPHQVTKEQIGLGNVLNYGIATQAEAETGAINTAFMTPLSVKQAITFQALNPLTQALNTHVSRTDNPHGVTKAQVGLSNVNNYGTVTDAATAQNNTVTNQYMTPQATAWAIANMITNYDSRYVRKSTNEDTSLQVISGELYAYVAGAWRVIWPPKWQ